MKFIANAFHAIRNQSIDADVSKAFWDITINIS